MTNDIPSCALVVVDLQRYYLDPASSFRRWAESRSPEVLDYIEGRVRTTVLPSLSLLFATFRARKWPVVYLRLCGTRPDRSDLHRIFREAHTHAAREGYPDLYPLSGDPLADILPEAAPRPGDTVFDKTTFSGFASGGLSGWLFARGIRVLVLAGLATSQCVDTTARDGSDQGYGIIHIEDAQADYSPDEHYAALFASRGVCGGTVLRAKEFCDGPEGVLAGLAKRELLQ